MVQFSPATREARVRFPANASFLFSSAFQIIIFFENSQKKKTSFEKWQNSINRHLWNLIEPFHLQPFSHSTSTAIKIKVEVDAIR